MAGKSILVIFFQDWCPICNGWSRELFRQITEAYGDDPRVALVAVKTDGGSLNNAVDYLKERTDVSKWLVALDENSIYYNQAVGLDELYRYIWINPAGIIAESDKAGRSVAGSEPKIVWLAAPNNQKKMQEGAAPLIADSTSFADELQPAIWFAEHGLFLSALKEAATLSSKPELKDDLTKLRAVIAEHLDSTITQLTSAVEDATNEYRYLDYLSLCKIAKDFEKAPQGVAAKNATTKVVNEAWLQEEEKAFGEYKSIMRRAGRADDERAQKRVKGALEKLAEKYPNTTYGRIAASSADE